jgi:uncharacterized protein YpmB
MKKLIASLVIIFMVFLINPQDLISETLKGETGSSWKWGSGWLDLARMMDFKKGDKLELQIGGTASKIIVRLLAKGVSSDSPSGIVGGALEVPSTRAVELELDSDYNNIVQISVHGHSNPWGLYDLGAQNGPATLLKVDYYARTDTEPKATKEKEVKYQRLQGEIGSSSKWGSGWLDLSETMNFKKGDKLRLHIGGTANKILVRLLARGISPDTPSGIVDGAVEVPSNRLIELQLDSEYNNIVQISVHGHSNPWGLYNLGAQNGPATILSCEYCR